MSTIAKRARFSGQMTRFTFSLTEGQLRRLEQHALDQGVSAAEALRRMLDAPVLAGEGSCLDCPELVSRLRAAEALLLDVRRTITNASHDEAALAAGA